MNKTQRLCQSCRCAVDWTKTQRPGARFAVRACAKCGFPTRPLRVRTKPKMPAPPGTVSVANLDVAFSLFVRHRDGRCRLCGQQGPLDCAHVFSRRYRATRWNPRNALALCRTEHVYYTRRPKEWRQVCVDMLGLEEYELLRIVSLRGRSPDLAATLRCLQGCLGS